MSKHLCVDFDLAQEVLDYLVTRPYGEVFAMVDKLRVAEACECSEDVTPTD